MVVHVNSVAIDSHRGLYHLEVTLHEGEDTQELDLYVPAYLIKTLEDAEDLVTRMASNIYTHKKQVTPVLWPYVDMHGVTWRVDYTEV